MKATKADYKALPRKVQAAAKVLFLRCMPDCACAECCAIGIILKYCLTVKRQKGKP
jgi:hypothetical protein